LISRKRVAGAVAALAVALLGWQVLFGRLAPYTGVFLGFDHVESKGVLVRYHTDRATAAAVLGTMDELVPAISRTIELARRQRIEVILCASDDEYRRLTGSSARFFTAGSGRVFVSARPLGDANAGKIHLRVYLAHELTHALVAQHHSLRVARSFPPWLAEGLATFAAGQTGVDGYFDEAGVRSWISQGRVVPPSDYVHGSRTGSVEALPEAERFHFVYSEFAFFVRDLMQRDGREQFQRYLLAVNEGEDWSESFTRIFGRPPDERFEDFRRRFIEGALEQHP
jgi:hypothetical protein